MGAVAATGDTSPGGLRWAAVLGTVMGSFTVQAFSADRLAALTRDDIDGRVEEFKKVTGFG